MPLLNDQVQNQIQHSLADLPRPVRIRLTHNPHGCEMCDETRILLEELAALHDQISLEVQLEHDEGLPEEFQQATAIKLLAKDSGGAWVDYGVAFYGIPSGYELTSLVEAIKLVSHGDSQLQEATRHALAQIDTNIDIHVYVTPTCPSCPRAVVLAHQMALETPFLRAAMVEAMEFPDASQKRGVYSVPHSTINDLIDVIGAVPEPQLLIDIQRAAMAA